MTDKRTRYAVMKSESRETRTSDKIQLLDSNENTQTLQRNSESNQRNNDDDTISSTSIDSLKIKYVELLVKKKKILRQKKIVDLKIE